MMWYYMYPETKDVSDLPFYVISIGLHELQPSITRENGYEYDQFFFNTCGSGTLDLDGRHYTLEEGSAFFVPAHIPHTYTPDGDIWDVRWMVPGGYGLKAVYEKFGIEKGGAYELKDETELDRILNKMRTDIITNPVNGSLLAAGNVYNFIIEFVNQTVLKEEKNEKKPYDNEMMLLKDYVSTHFMYQITLDDLCKVVPVTHQHLCRIFEKNSGLRPMEYINRVRVDMARGLLLYGTEPVSSIAKKCGFNNVNYFCRVFKKMCKVTPLEYRNSVLKQ